MLHICDAQQLFLPLLPSKQVLSCFGSKNSISLLHVAFLSEALKAKLVVVISCNLF
jgi:hypothetical protein